MSVVDVLTERMDAIESATSRIETLVSEASTPKPDGIWVHHSLADEGVLFEPRDGRQVKWYACGPTVYAPSHAGHARTYVTFDIIRNVLQKYFGFSVVFAMNITDIDDKIIRGARQEYLLKRYQNEERPGHVLVDDASKAFELLLQRQQERVDRAEAKLSECDEKDDSVRSRFNAVARGERGKLGNLRTLRDTMLSRVEKQWFKREDLFKLVSSQFAEWLDITQGEMTTLEPQYVRKYAQRYEEQFFHDMRALGVRDPDILTRVSEYVEKIVEYVQTILDKGFAYCVEGSVYFDVAAYQEHHNYPKLNPEVFDEKDFLDEGEGDMSNQGEKRSRHDFALWKRSKPGEPMWDSPWGGGRPGWHIECTTMASDIFGDFLDIHSGGVDLRFPHHDNEIAQSCAYFSNPEMSQYLQQWVGYWLHSGHLHVKGSKMSKSLKNFLSVQDLLALASARQIRIWFVMHSWDKKIDFSPRALSEAKAKEKDLIELLQLVQRMERRNEFPRIPGGGLSAEDEGFLSAIDRHQLQVDVAFRNNFDYKAAFENVMDLASLVSTHLQGLAPHLLLVQKAVSFVVRILEILGIDVFEYRRPAKDTNVLDAVARLRGVATTMANHEQAVLETIQHTLMAYKTDLAEIVCESLLGDKVRTAGLTFLSAVLEHHGDDPAQVVNEHADVLRQRLEQLDIRLEDVGDRLDRPDDLVVWKLYEKSYLKRKKIDSVRQQILTMEERIREAQENTIDPATFFVKSRKFKGNGYGDIDENGIPQTKNGQVLSEKTRERLATILDKHRKKAEASSASIGPCWTTIRFLKGAMKLLEQDHTPVDFALKISFQELELTGTAHATCVDAKDDDRRLLRLNFTLGGKSRAVTKFLCKTSSNLSQAFIENDNASLVWEVTNWKNKIVSAGYVHGRIIRVVATGIEYRRRGLAFNCASLAADFLFFKGAPMVGIEPIVDFWYSHFMLRSATDEERDEMWGAAYVRERLRAEPGFKACVLTRKAWKKTKKMW